MTKSIESKNSRININFKQDIINGKHLTTGFLSLRQCVNRKMRIS